MSRTKSVASWPGRAEFDSRETSKPAIAVVWVWFLVILVTGWTGEAAAQRVERGITLVPGVRVGHHAMPGRPTGCTVVLTEGGAVAGVDVRGAAPGTRETDLLDPVNTVQRVHAIVLAGGSAYGLAAADGVMDYLEQRGVGVDVRAARVPIVPAAILLDLSVGDDPSIRPDASCGRAAALAATDGPVEEGSVGAGAGATVGKLRGFERAMKAGIGSAAIELPNGLIVSALVAVNALGDVIDPATGEVVAGVRTPDGRGLADARRLLREGLIRGGGRAGENTSLGVIATNAALSKAQATKIAQMAHDGFARAISPVHTPADGDVIFALGLGVREGPADVLLIGALAAEVMADAIVRAVRAAEGLPGLPSWQDLVRDRSR